MPYWHLVPVFPFLFAPENMNDRIKKLCQPSGDLAVLDHHVLQADDSMVALEGSGGMKKSVYVETTVFSFYHDDRPESARRREITRAWWRTERRRYQVFTSRFTVKEASVPVYPGWKNVVALAGRQKMLDVTDEIAGIIDAYLAHWVMPSDDAGDAAHLAVASFHGVEYLLTWNCTHLANANKFDHIRVINRRLGLVTPDIVTPEQLFKEQ